MNDSELKTHSEQSLNQKDHFNERYASKSSNESLNIFLGGKFNQYQILELEEEHLNFLGTLKSI